ncbi:MAG: hypothetical protein HN955_04575 [Prolixibacteraceae bacterium]|jgi:hypothetical protein|nr:hypothetical protein [Prolixibacteraceae bacterium]
METFLPKPKSKFYNWFSHFIGFEYHGKDFSMKQIEKLVKKGLIVDGTGGGLLLGRSHSSGGIYVLYPTNSNFRLAMEVEGYEYIINRNSTQKYQSEIGKINNFDRDKSEYFGGVQYDSDTKILDMNNPKNPLKPKYLVTDNGGFAIINKYSTAKYLKNIESINRTK